MRMVKISIFKAIEFQKAVEEKFGVHIHVSDNCSGLYFTFDDAPAEEIIDFARDYFANHEDGSMDIILTPNHLHMSLAEKEQ